MGGGGMNYTASPALCEELYELTHWLVTDDSGRYPAHYDALDEKQNPVYEPDVPAYDLGFMLRKLPRIVKLDYNPDAGTTPWTASYVTEDSWRSRFADTPEDAVCQLIIHIIKAGVLKP